MAKNDAKKFCEKCKKTMSIDEFYKSNNYERYPDGRFKQCKKCITMHVDNWNKDTFLWILQEADVPYIVDEWNKLLLSYGKDKSKVTGMTILGRYFSKMHLKQYDKWRWKDTAFLQQVADLKTEESMRQAGYGAAEIQQVIDENKTVVPDEGYIPPPPSYDNPNGYQSFAPDDDEEDLSGELTEEDKLYLKIKWGKTYRPDEWIKLETLYQQMKNDYVIEGAGHEDTLKLVCKTSLKSNQLLDMGDVDGAQKMIKMYESMMKSGHFTADQNKKEQSELLDTISEFALMCETEGFIPRFYTEEPRDKVDAVIKDLKEYTHSVMVEELNLGNLIESAVKQMALEERKEEDEDIDDEEVFVEGLADSAMTDKDHEEFFDMMEEDAISDEDVVSKFLENGEDL